MTTGRAARLDAREVGMAVLVPVGDDDQRVRARRARRSSSPRTRSGRRAVLRLVHRGRDRARTTVAPASSSSSISVSDGASRMSSVFGLNASPQTAMRVPSDRRRAASRSFSNSRCFCASFASSTGCSTLERHAALRRRAHERLHVLREAGAAVARAREEKRGPDARIADPIPFRTMSTFGADAARTGSRSRS